MEKEKDEVFTTDDIALSAVALSAGATFLASHVDGTTGKLMFNFRGISKDFDTEVLNSDLRIKARDVVTNSRVVIEMIYRHKKATTRRGGR